MFCKNFKSEFQKAKRLLEDKAVKIAAEAAIQIGYRLIIVLESEATARWVDMTPTGYDNELVSALVNKLRDVLRESELIKEDADTVEDNDKLIQRTRARLKAMGLQQAKDQIGILVARVLHEYIKSAKGIQEKIGVIKIIIEGILLSIKK